MRERRAARGAALAWLVAGALALSACSSGPSMVLVWVQAPDNLPLPPIRILRAGLTDSLTPKSPCLDLIRVDGDVDGSVRPLPYVLPLYLTINVNRDLAGARTLVIDGYAGLADASGAVDNGCADAGEGLHRTIPTAAGSAPVPVVAGMKTQTDRPVTLVAGSCGDRILDCPAEQCDDGNHATGDGCDPDCRLEDPAAGPIAEGCPPSGNDAAASDGAPDDAAASD